MVYLDEVTLSLPSIEQPWLAVTWAQNSQDYLDYSYHYLISNTEPALGLYEDADVYINRDTNISNASQPLQDELYYFESVNRLSGAQNFEDDMDSTMEDDGISSPYHETLFDSFSDSLFCSLCLDSSSLPTTGILHTLM